MPYIPWSDHRGYRLELSALPECEDPLAGPGAGCLLITAGDFHLPMAKLAEFVGTLYESAGQPAPIVLPRRPDLGTATIFLGGYSVQRDGTAVTVLVGPEERRLTTDEAREYAAAIASRADEAEAGKAETDALAELMHASRECCTGGPSEMDRQQARAILRAGYRAPERTP